MRGLPKLSRLFTKNFSHQDTIVMDFGSVTTRMIVNKTAFVQEPTVIALHKKTKSVIAVGRAAQELLGKAPPAIEVIFPLRRGKIVDVFATQRFLELMTKSHGLSGGAFVRRDIRMAIASNLSLVQRDFLLRTLKAMSFTHVDLVKKNLALLHQLRAEKYQLPVLCAVDIGGMTTEMTLFAQQEAVMQRTVQIGGEDFTQELIHVLRTHHHCEVGWQTAEKMKQTIGRMATGQEGETKMLVVRGLDTVTSLPKTIQVSATDFDEVFLRLGEDIYAGLRDLCQDAPSELVTAALDQGILLTGGGCLLSGMTEFLMKKLQCAVHRSPTPFEDVVKGL